LTAAAAAAGVQEVSAKPQKGFLPGLGSAVAGAASAAVAGAATAVAGAATAVAGAATAVAGAAAAAATSGIGGGSSQQQQQQQQQQIPGQFLGQVPTVSLTRKFWVAQEDVSAVMYRILQHMPLLPSTAHSASSSSSSSSKSKQQQAGFGTQWQQQQQQQQQQFQDAAQQQQQQQQTRQQQRLQEFAGFTTTLHTVYFDNKGLELYHGRLYLRPNTQTLKARWIGHSDSCWAPARVVLERKVYKEGWKGESNAKQSLLIAGDVLPSYLVATYCLGDALSQLYELPALQQTLQQTLGHLQQRRQQRQVAQQRQQQLAQLSPFAAASAAAAAAAVDRTHAGSSTEPAAAGSQAAADAEVARAVAAAGIRVPQGVVLGSRFSYSMSHGSGILGSSSNCGQLVHSSEGVCMLEQQHQQHQQQQQQQVDTADSHVHWGPDVAQQQQQQQKQQQQQQQSGLVLLKSQLSSQLQQAQQQQQQQQQQLYPQHPAAAAAGYVDDSSGSEDDDSDDEDVQFSGSSSSNNPAAACSSCQQQQQQQQPISANDMPLSAAATLPAAAPAAEAGFEDAYLDPPMPSSDQLSLFSEVQRLIGRKRLQPVVHCVLQRMLFAMPFDERLKITLDTDVAISAVVST
jgi:hypothetical protein